MNYTFLESVDAYAYKEKLSFLLNGSEPWIFDVIDIIDYRTRSTLVTRRVESKYISKILLQNIIDKALPSVW